MISNEYYQKLLQELSYVVVPPPMPPISSSAECSVVNSLPSRPIMTTTVQSSFYLPTDLLFELLQINDDSEEEQEPDLH
ncbi:unnamed protein product [Hymenolepis diminuta]|uniref:Uncharacterized protein n=1 Tax=Hymenolepis diminuta TaxID=6216 RepID=A0A564YWX0_HYMDI|nr:unnamed protein product [Hymenolepis diminuta]